MKALSRPRAHWGLVTDMAGMALRRELVRTARADL